MPCLSKEKQKPLTQKRALKLLSYEPESGKLKNRIYRPGCKAGTEAGTVSNGYLQVQLDMVFYKAHRVIWLMQTGKWPEHCIDHRDGNRLNNRWENLREATWQQNALNRSHNSNNKSGVKGVYPRSGGRTKWYATIDYSGKRTFLGSFEDKSDAIKARIEAEQEIFGEWARRCANVA